MYKQSILYIFVTFFSLSVFALEDNLQKAIEISSHGTKVQSERLKIAAENMANEHSISTQAGGNPYRRKIIFAKNNYNKKLKTNIVTIRKVDVDTSPFILKYQPNHPSADLDGYVKYPNIHKEIEKADAGEAQRSYEANLTIMEMSKSMIQKTIDAIR